MSKPNTTSLMDMRHVLPAFGVCGLLLGAAMAAPVESLENTYTVGDLLLIPPAQWQKDAGLAVSQAELGRPMSLESRGSGSLGARPVAQCVLTPKTKADIQAGNVTGELTVQFEWFDAKGAFLGATPLASVRGLPLELTGEDVSSYVPGDIQPVQFGFKFWLGEAAKCEISNVIVTAPVGFKAKNVTLMQRYNVGAPVDVEEGLELENLRSCWEARLKPDSTVSSFILTERSKFDSNGLVLANILTLNSGASVSVHVLCWNAADTFLGEVSLIEGAAEAGDYEAAFAIFKDQFPPETDRISFKIWIGGAQPRACIEGIYYGAVQIPPL